MVSGEANRDEREPRPRLVLAGAVVVVGLLAWGIWHLLAKKPAAKGPPPVPVAAAAATTRDVPIIEPALGTVLSLDMVNVMPEVNGRITGIYFKQGDVVKAGQRLFEIDPRPYQAALQQAQGQLARDRASLAEASMDLARYRKLASQNSIELQTYQDQEYVVGQDRGTVTLDEGNVAAATVNLSFCRVTAPIAGRTGMLQVDLGNYVQAASAATQSVASSTLSSGSTAGTGSGGAAGGGSSAAALVTITQLQPIYVSFSVPENQLDTIRANQAQGALPVAAYAATGQLLATGTLSLINNQVATATGTITLEATFANGDERLWPNEFVAARLTEYVLRNSITIPSTALLTGPTGQYVYAIGADHKVKRVEVTVVATQQGTAVIGKGLTAGEEVVTDGQYRLDDGVLVSVQRPATAAPAQASTAASAPSASMTPAAK